MKIKCEYCGSVVECQTNCPNCGALLSKKVIEIVETITPHGQIRRDEKGRLHYEETYTVNRKELISYLHSDNFKKDS